MTTFIFCLWSFKLCESASTKPDTAFKLSFFLIILEGSHGNLFANYCVSSGCCSEEANKNDQKTRKKNALKMPG